jgi:hypothetical protein
MKLYILLYFLVGSLGSAFYKLRSGFTTFWPLLQLYGCVSLLVYCFLIMQYTLYIPVPGFNRATSLRFQHFCFHLTVLMLIAVCVFCHILRGAFLTVFFCSFPFFLHITCIAWVGGLAMHIFPWIDNKELVYYTPSLGFGADIVLLFLE